MSASRNDAERAVIPVEVSMAGVLALLVDARERACADDRSAAKTEVLLAIAGMSVAEIAAVTGKKGDTIRKTIRRGKAK